MIYNKHTHTHTNQLLTEAQSKLYVVMRKGKATIYLCVIGNCLRVHVNAHIS